MRGQRAPKIAVLLAAGQGTRLRPYTEETPKCLLRINNRPILDYVLDSLDRAGVRHVYIVVHHLQDQITSHLAANRPPHLAVEFCHQPRLTGTAQGLSATRDAITHILTPECPLLICATDYVMPPSYIADLVCYHQSHSCPITVSLREIATSQLASSSLALKTPDDQIIKIAEKPHVVGTTQAVAASLLYIAPVQIYRYLDVTPLSRRREYELPDTINLMISDGFCAKGLLQAPLPVLEQLLRDERPTPRGDALPREAS